jgi:NDP-sugar pyrophosphorylase family protein
MLDKLKTDNLVSASSEYIKAIFQKCQYPWELLPHISDYIREIAENSEYGFTEIEKGVFVGQNVTIAKTATVEAPAVIGKNTEIRPGAYIRGKVITGENCVLGNSSEFKNCVLLNGVQAPHYNYVGDSILGNKAHLGAGTICSNLKSDGKNVVVHGDMEYETGLRKIGGILADGADVGCNSVINPGTVIGKNTSAYPLVALRGVYPADCIIKSTKEVVKRI